MSTDTSRVHGRAMLVNLNVSQWTARKTDRKATKDVADANGVASKQSTYYKSLVEGKALDDIKVLVTKARAEHYRRTLPWSDTGPRILSNAGYMEYIKQMNAYNDEFKVLVDTFLLEYPLMRQEARRLLGGLFEETDYPTLQAVACKFQYRVAVMPLPIGEDFRCDVGTEEAARIRMEITASTGAALQAAQRDAFQRVKTMVENIMERLGNPNSRIHDALIDNARDLADLLPSLNINNDPLLNDMADSLRNKLGAVQPQALRDDPVVRQETFNAAKSMHNDLMDFFNGDL